MEFQNTSWLRLVGYCVIAALATAFGFALLFAGGAAFAAGQSSADVPQTTFSGMVTDDHCGAKHDRYSGKNASECARLCALNGSKYVLLLDGDKVYTLAGKDLALDKLAGQRATVTGVLQGNIINVTSVAAQHP